MNINFEKDPITLNLTDDELSLFSEGSEYLEKDTKNITSKFFDESKKVKDVWRYGLLYSNSKWVLQHVKGSEDKEICADNNNILIILESPHKDEYDKKFSPLGPAKGETGKAFYKYFISHVLSILKSLGIELKSDEKYSICFVNPVQYQTSLVEIHHQGLKAELRNKVWKALYPRYKKDFEGRLKHYKPKIIINACTSELKKELDEVLNMIEAQKFETSHPSNWNRIFAPFKKT